LPSLQGIGKVNEKSTVVLLRHGGKREKSQRALLADKESLYRL
jgi:hypothetical protein